MNDFRFWCYKVLPLVYDDSLSYYETLCKFIEYLNGLGEDVKEVVKEMQDLKDYVDNFIDTLDIESVVEAKLNELGVQHIQYSSMKDNLMNEIKLFEPDVVIEIENKCEISYNAYKVAVNCMDMSADMVIIDGSENLPDLKISFN